MRAIVRHRYGPPGVLRLEEIEKPAAADDEVLVRVRAASVNPLDWHFMRGAPSLVRLLTGVRGPKDARLGRDVAGQVEAVGRNVKGLRPGDEVYGAGSGAFAEYVCAREKTLAVKPANVTFEEAAAVPIAGLTALQALRDYGRVERGQTVLVNGAAGGVGTFAVQIARALGAEVTGVCSTRNVDLVRSLGAGSVIDYTRDDFTRTGRTCDVVLDCIGNHPLSHLRRALTSTGACVMVGGAGSSLGILAGMLGTFLLARVVKQRLVGFMASINSADLAAMRGLIESGQVRPVIDRQYALEDVPQAIAYLEEGHARGKVAISVAPRE